MKIINWGLAAWAAVLAGTTAAMAEGTGNYLGRALGMLFLQGLVVVVVVIVAIVLLVKHVRKVRRERQLESIRAAYGSGRGSGDKN